MGYGVRHMEFTFPGPYTLDVLEVTLPNPYVHLESFRSNGLMTTSDQTGANNQEGHRVVGAVNGDFFSADGAPVGNQVRDGMFVHGIASARSHLAVDAQDRPMIERLSFIGSVRTSLGSGFTLTGVNVSRTAGALVFYSPCQGPATATTGGVEASVRYVGGAIAGGDTLRVAVISINTGGNTVIPADGGVLSASPGSPAAFLGACRPGDTLTMVLGFDPPLRHILQTVGGAGRILLAGRNVTDSMASLEGITSSFTDVRNPRTFLGFNRDTTKLFLCTVDGRQTSSQGMTFDEMATFLISLGASDAFNLDGGGSTTMVVRGETVNSPSDPAGERRVANSIQIISTAPQGTLSMLAIQPRRFEACQGQSVLFVASGTNEYCDPVSLPPDMAWHVDSWLGTISAGGLFTAATTDDSGWVRVQWGTARDSARVIVRTLSAIRPRSPSYVMVAGDSVTMRILGTTSQGATVALQNRAAAFTPSSPILQVEQDGVALATGTGTAALDVHYGELTCQALFDCTGNDTSVIADALDRLDDWSISRVNTDEMEVGVRLAPDPRSTRTVLLIDHSHLPGPKGVDFITILPLAGKPDSIVLRVYGSGNSDTLQLVISDRRDSSFVLNGGSVVDWTSDWDEVGFSTGALSPPGLSFPEYPITIRKVRVRFGGTGGTGGFVQGLLYLSDLRAHYSSRTGTGIDGTRSGVPHRFELLQNFPNPFNPETVIVFQLPAACNVRLTVCDLLGREVASLANGRMEPGRYRVVFDASGLSSGIYLYRLAAGGFVATRKTALLK